MKMDTQGETKTLCKASKKDGTPCSVPALPGSDYCFFHDPSRADERREAQVQGGRQNRLKTLPEDAPDVKIANCQDVMSLLSETINQARKGRIDPRTANAVGYLANIFLKATEQGEMEKRIAELEAATKSKSPPPFTSEVFP